MQKYTLGVYLSEELDKVVLIHKLHPEWQKGLLNFPGGTFQSETELSEDCISRKFKDETGVQVGSNDWIHIGSIQDLEGKEYIVHVFTTVRKPDHQDIISKTDEVVNWYALDDLPSNLVDPTIEILYSAIDSIMTTRHLQEISNHPLNDAI